MHIAIADRRKWRIYIRKYTLALCSCLWVSATLGASSLQAPSGGGDKGFPPPGEAACDDQTSSPAHPKLNVDAEGLAELFRSPQNGTELLTNLKLVLDKRLLGEPAFFSDIVLKKLFAARSIKWISRGAPDFLDNRLIHPSRVARITVGTAGLEGMDVNVGVNHYCLPKRTDPTHGGAQIEAHTYDAGYIGLTWPPAAKLEMRRVRAVFGHEPGNVDPSCTTPPNLRYAVEAKSAMSLDEILVITDKVDSVEECKARQSEAVTPLDPVRQILLRYREDDRTYRFPPQP
jgi:hypothetical protein